MISLKVPPAPVESDGMTSLDLSLGPRVDDLARCPHDRAMTDACASCGVPRFDTSNTPTGRAAAAARELEAAVRASWSVR